MSVESNYDEGEILEVDLKETEKASLSKPSVDGSSVDRHSSRRILPEPSSRPRSYSPNSTSHHDSAYKEGSPMLDDYYSDSSRKRRRDYDSEDTRRHKVHYEGDQNKGAAARRARISYADLDSPDEQENASATNLLDAIPRRTQSDSKRARTRSRSPPHRPQIAFSMGRNDSRREIRDDRDRHKPDRRNGGYEYQSVSERAGRDFPSPSVADYSRRDAESRRHEVHSSGYNHRRGDLSSSNARAEKNLSIDKSHKRCISDLRVQFEETVDIYAYGRNEPSTSELKSEPVEDPVVQEPLDEAKLLEERRKRREAIKAKYKGQATPLLVSALHINTSAPNSPMSGTESYQSRSSQADVVSDNLATSVPPSGVASPNEFSILKEQVDGFEILPTSNIINGLASAIDKAGDENEPSAADYDPIVDMEEDRMRQDKRINSGMEVSSSSYNEILTNKPHDILMPQEVVETNDFKAAPSSAIKPKADDDFDMFADGDDDDMFAPTSPKLSKAVNPLHDLGVPVVAQAKQLDVSMLDNRDDHEGYYRVILGELIDDRYHIQSNLGKGMFSGVVRALDKKTDQLVAIKIIRNNETMRKAGLKEIDILQKLMNNDPDDKKHLVRLERSFDHQGHLCIVFENLSINLREVLKKFGRDIGINLRAVRAYAQQMFLGLSLMKKCNILHADIKPDNVLVNEGRNILKICDLGSASDATENEITPYLVSRFYRAPEIILGMPYDFAIDMWSVGCTLYELYTGKILFTGRTNNQMLRSVMETQGKFNQKMLRKASFAHLHFDDMLNFRSVEQDKITGKDVIKVLNYTKPPRELKSRLLTTAIGMSEAELKELNLFIDLLDKCLALNPEKRITPLEALKHPFIHRIR